MTLIGGVKHKGNIIVYGDSKLTGATKNTTATIKINHYGNIIISFTGFLLYAQLWSLYINSAEHLLTDNLFRRLIQHRIKTKQYEWDSDIIFALFNSFYDWLRKGDQGYKGDDDVLGSISFLIVTEKSLYRIAWGSIEQADPYINLGSGGVCADSIFETLKYLNGSDEEETLKRYLKTLVNVCPKVVDGVDKPFYLCTPGKIKNKKNFYSLIEQPGCLAEVKTEDEIDEFFKLHFSDKKQTRKKKK